MDFGIIGSLPVASTGTSDPNALQWMDDAALKAMNGAPAFHGPITSRREYSGLIYQAPNGSSAGFYDFTPGVPGPPCSAASGCSADIDVSWAKYSSMIQSNGWSVVGFWHTHPAQESHYELNLSLDPYDRQAWLQSAAFFDSTYPFATYNLNAHETASQFQLYGMEQDIRGRPGYHPAFRYSPAEDVVNPASDPPL
jgi:hypothetical protein